MCGHVFWVQEERIASFIDSDDPATESVVAVTHLKNTVLCLNLGEIEKFFNKKTFTTHPVKLKSITFGSKWATVIIS